MTDTGMRMKSVIGAGFILAMSLAALAAYGQEETEDDELLPAVDTSAITAEDAQAIKEMPPTTTGNRIMDSMELARTEITGNQELPKVLYIVPWRKSDPGDLMGRPVNTLLDEVLAPVDREEFTRQVEYYDDLNGNKEEP